MRINYHFFKENDIGGIFGSFGGLPYQVINAVYPRQFKPWEMAHVPNNFWKNPKNIEQTLDWFLFQKLSFSPYEEALKKLKRNDLFQSRMTGFFQAAFDFKLSRVKQWIKEQNNNDCIKA